MNKWIAVALLAACTAPSQSPGPSPSPSASPSPSPSPATLTLPSSPFDYGTRAVGSSTNQSFSVHYAGDVPATGVTLAVPSGFAVSSSTCGSSVAADCVVVVAFQPTAATLYSGALSLSYDNGTLVTTSISGTGGSPALLAISDGPGWSFDTVLVGATADHTFSVSNSGQSPASVTSVGVGAPFTVLSSSCAMVAPSGSCSVVVRFAPVASGAANDTLSVAYSDGINALTATRAVSGTGQLPAMLALSDGPSFDFGSIAPGGSADHTFYLTNPGGLPATGLMASAFGSSAFDWKGGSYPGFGGTCGTQLAAGASCHLVVRFTGPSPAGSATGTLGLGDDSGHSASLALSGASTTNADLRITDFPALYYSQYGLPPDPAIYSFGTVGVGRSAEHSFSVFNAGGGTATLTIPAGLSGAYLWKGSNSYPGAGGSCGASLAAGASCVMVVSFAPSAAGDQPSTLTLGYFDGSANRSATRSLDGAGSAFAILALSDYDLGSFGPAFDFGLVGVGQAATQSLYLTNNGNLAATALAASIGSPFTIDASACGAQLPPGANCPVVVSFQPLSAGAANAIAKVAYDDGSGTPPSPAARAVQGTGTTAALLEIDAGNGPPSPLDFGTHGVGSTTTLNLTLRNPGGATAQSIGFPANGAAFVTGQPFLYVAGTCGSSLAAGANCSFSVKYAPSSAGASSATLSLGYDTTESITYALEGSATASAFLTVQEENGGDLSTPFDFGTLGRPSSQLFQVSNLGGADATSLAGSVGGLFSFAGGFPGSGGTCGSKLSPNGTCTIAVTFTPSGTLLSSSTIDVSYLDSATSTTLHATRDVAGASSQGPVVVLNNHSCSGCGSDTSGDNFGVVGLPVSRSYYLDNNGVGAALDLQFATSGPAFVVSSDAQLTTCVAGAPLAAGGECRITVVYTPSGSGPQGDVLVISFSDGTHTTTIDKGLSGTATSGPQLQISSCQNCGVINSLDFGSAAVPITRMFIVTNVGAASAGSLGAAAFSDAVFSFAGGFPGQAGGCGATLASGASCAISVLFTPNLDTVRHQDSLSITYSGGASAPVTVSATDTNGPLLAIGDYPGSGSSPPQPFDFGASGVPVTHTFYVTNSGLDAHSLVFSLSPADAAFSLPASSDPSACQSTLLAGASCNLLVRFAPAADTAVHTSGINLVYTGGSTSRAIQGSDTTQPILQIYDCAGGPSQCGASATSGLSGSGSPPPSDFGSTGGTVTRTFTLFNSGGGPATLAASLSPAGYFSFSGGYPGAGGTCAGSLAAGQGCTVVVSFTRSDSGTHSETANLDVTAPAVSRALTAVETDVPIVAISDCQSCGGNNGPPFDFGVWGADIAHVFYVNNSGITAATLSTGSFSGPDAAHFDFSGGAFPGINGTCSTAANALGPGGQCLVEVRFKVSGAPATLPPTALSGQLDLGFNGGSAPRALTASATDSAKLYISDNGSFSGGIFQTDLFDFGTAGTLQTHQFTVTNSGALAATLTTSVSGAHFAFSGSGVFPGGGTCSNTIAAGQSCTFFANFDPAGLADQQLVSGVIDLNYTGGAHADSPASRAVSGRFTSQALIGISNCFNCGGTGGGPPFDFGHWGVPRAMSFAVHNSGGGAAPIFTAPAIGPLFAYSGGSFPGTNGDCPTSGPGLAAGATCSLDVSFNPSGPAGPASGTISLGYGAAQPATQQVTGTVETGVYLVLAANSAGWQPASFLYGSWGTSTAATSRRNQFWVFNQGAQSTVVTGTVSGNFSFPGGAFPGEIDSSACGSAIGPGHPQSCNVTVEFDPSSLAANPQTGVLGVSGGSSSASLSLSGSYAAGANLVVDSNSNPVGFCGDSCGPDFWGTHAVGDISTRSYFITNTGNAVSAALTPLLQYAAPFSSGSSGSDCTTPQLTGGLAPGEQCTLSVVFTPPPASSGSLYSGKIGVSSGGSDVTRSFQAQEL